jgi:hypothetical protein
VPTRSEPDYEPLKMVPLFPLWPIELVPCGVVRLHEGRNVADFVLKEVAAAPEPRPLELVRAAPVLVHVQARRLTPSSLEIRELFP